MLLDVNGTEFFKTTNNQGRAAIEVQHRNWFEDVATVGCKCTPFECHSAAVIALSVVGNAKLLNEVRIRY